MTSHYHGRVLNYSELGRSFGISDTTARSYLSILEKTFLVRLMQPWHVNIKKRLVKQPKLYLRDSGIFHILQSIGSMEHLTSHPKLGASWEGFAIEMAMRSIGYPADRFYFYATHNGAELDLFWQQDGKNYGIECTYADAPRITRSMHVAIEDLNLSHLWVICPGMERYQLSSNIEVLPVEKLPVVFQPASTK
jgi:predicted AAA+ superfamily ATPase